MLIARKDKQNREYPGGQTRLPSFNLIYLLFCFLAVVFFILSMFNIVRDSRGLITHSSPTLINFLQFSFLDTKTSCLILVMLLGAIIARNQIILGFCPKLIYSSGKTLVSAYTLHLKKHIWTVRLRNVGPGAADIQQVLFRVGIETIIDGPYCLNFSDLVGMLSKNGLRIDRDYCLSNITQGYTLPSKEERAVFEMLLARIHQIRQLDMRIVFLGPLGDKYEKELFLIPRSGIAR